MILIYFSVCDLRQLGRLRAQECRSQQVKEYINVSFRTSRFKPLRAYFFTISFAVISFFFFFFFFFLPLSPLLVPFLLRVQERHTERFWEAIRTQFVYDPLSFVGLSRAYRGSIWNWVDLMAYGGLWANIVSLACFRGQRARDDARHGELVVFTTMLLWVKLLGFAKDVNLEFASFVLMLIQVGRDISKFMLVFLIFMLLFGHALHLRPGARNSDQYGFHDDGAPSTFSSFGKTMQAMALLGVMGGFDSDSHLQTADLTILSLAAFMLIVVMLNVLIAIVSDSYTSAMAKSYQLYTDARYEILTDRIAIFGKRVFGFGSCIWFQPMSNRGAFDDMLRGQLTKYAERAQQTDSPDVACRIDRTDQESKARLAISKADADLKADSDASKADRHLADLKADLAISKADADLKADALKADLADLKADLAISKVDADLVNTGIKTHRV